MEPIEFYYGQVKSFISRADCKIRTRNEEFLAKRRTKLSFDHYGMIESFYLKEGTQLNGPHVKLLSSSDPKNLSKIQMSIVRNGRVASYKNV